MTKSRAHFQFVLPDSAEGKDIRNVLVQHKLADHLYPHKPGDVVSQVQQKSGKAFTSHNHTQAWRKFQARPRKETAQPDNTKRDWCVYHAAHKDYTYSDQWIEFLVAEVSDNQKFDDLKATKI